MFGLKIQGRLGNQLFQYAYARVLAQKFHTSFFFLSYKYFYVNRYFEIKADSYFNNLLKGVFFYIRNGFSVKEIMEDQFQHPDANLMLEQDRAIYNGFYQSALYHHSQMADLIKEELTIKPAFRINIKDFVENERPNIVVHVRRTDYVTFGGDHVGGINLTLPLEYYQRALELLPVDTCNVIFLSDDMDFVKENLHAPNAIYAGKNSEITDFQLIMQADYLVLANSSFSWWGAYLNKTAKKIISPKYWLGIKIHKEYPVGIVHPAWTAID